MGQAEVRFGPLLRAHRGAAGLTQEELAARAGLSTEAISTLERGSRRAPRAATVECLAGALKLKPEQRAEFAAAAMGSSELIAADNGTTDTAVYEREPGTKPRSSIPPYRKVMPLVVVIALLGVLGFVAYSGLSQNTEGQSPTAPSTPPSTAPSTTSARRPVITDLSVTPSTLSPSPSNHTVISFHIDVDSRVTLTVRDSNGRIVKKLLENDPKPAGPVYKPYFGYDGANTLPPGRYAVVVSAAASGSTATAQAPLDIV